MCAEGTLGITVGIDHERRALALRASGFGLRASSFGLGTLRLTRRSLALRCATRFARSPEVVRVLYDSGAVSLRELLEEFFLRAHDPTSLNRQGGDTGTQYRSGAYVNTPEELEVVREVMEALQPEFGGKIVTEVALVSLWNRAEEYHQGYLEKGGRFGKKQSAAKGCSDPIRCYG